MSALDEHLDLFKADWIARPDLLAQRIRAAGVSDRFTAERAAWCAEIHEHLRVLVDELDIDLLLMGGNGAALRFDAVKQRGSPHGERRSDSRRSAQPARARGHARRIALRAPFLAADLELAWSAPHRAQCAVRVTVRVSCSRDRHARQRCGPDRGARRSDPGSETSWTLGHSARAESPRARRAAWQAAPDRAASAPSGTQSPRPPTMRV